MGVDAIFIFASEVCSNLYFQWLKLLNSDHCLRFKPSTVSKSQAIVSSELNNICIMSGWMRTMQILKGISNFNELKSFFNLTIGQWVRMIVIPKWKPQTLLQQNTAKLYCFRLAVGLVTADIMTPIMLKWPWLDHLQTLANLVLLLAYSTNLILHMCFIFCKWP